MRAFWEPLFTSSAFIGVLGSFGVMGRSLLFGMNIHRRKEAGLTARGPKRSATAMPSKTKAEEKLEESLALLAAGSPPSTSPPVRTNRR